jgi:H/ACA ribonucleoprotein complex subunit 3
MRMRKCPSCGAYTFKPDCAKCNVKTTSPAPPRFSPEDRYGEYRRRAMSEK